MARVVLKFGGSSVADAARIQNVARKVRPFVQRGDQTAVVVSAMGKTTDNLISLAGSVGSSMDRREMDQLLATGEQQTIALLAMALRSLGIPAKSYTGVQAGFRAEGFYSEGRIRRIHAQLLEEDMEEGVVPVVAGFQAMAQNGDFITLGRGGSDLSAVALAAALQADACHIYTDVAGVYSADPRIVPQAKKLKGLSYAVCSQMAVLGAKVLQARSVEMAMRYDVPVYVASSFDDEEGSWVIREEVSEGLVVQGVAHDRNVVKVAVLGVPDQPGIAAKLFTELATGNVTVDMIIQSVMRGEVNDIAFLAKKEVLADAIRICQNYAREVEAQGVTYDTEVARVSVVGSGIANHPATPGRMFNALAAKGINIEMISSTPLAITCVVNASAVEDAVRALHAEFVEKGE